MRIFRVLILSFFLLHCNSNDDDDDNSCVAKTFDSELVCYEIYQPVCGCNNITYSNDCYAGASGVSSWTEGECSN
jgi:hypothetical protein|tara:strand:+ start:360 stop:584 length:225 start_codon:yes stop_codon:yes gene_type:complete